MVLHEPHFHYAPIKLNNTCSKLFGYYQSYKYFARHRTTLLAELCIKETQDQYRLKVAAAATALDLSRTVALHFRIGDYAQNPAYHPLLPLAYYAEALSLLQKKNLIKNLLL